MSAKLNEILILSFFLIIICSCKKEENNHSRTLEQELEELNAFILEKEANGLDVDTTDLGVYYIIRKEGEEGAPFPERGDTCYISYLCYFLNGPLYESSHDIFPNGIWEIIYKKADIIPGLSDGIGQMNKDAKIDIIIPSYLAYGDKKEGNIPPFTTLIYVTTMHDLRPVKD